MISAVFHVFIYDPLYNGLVFLVGIMPTHDVGLAVIVLTILVRVLLFPLSRRAVETQLAMKKIAPDVERLKQKYKANREEQAKALFALYREHGVHPFASIGLLLAQLPVLFALYWIFASGGLPDIHPELLYSFISPPEGVNMAFLGLLDMAGHSIELGVLAAITQFVYTRLSMGAPEKKSAGESATFSADLARSFEVQARYVLPATFVVLSFFIPSAAMLYLTTSNAFMIGQELFAGRRF
ncbi:membrane protein insertase YidC [Candidatus Kaiserbacteria bacterium]|nr:membrane protein insertase YidC [Candidatus Kaiserbacteria bacterium]